MLFGLETSIQVTDASLAKTCPPGQVARVLFLDEAGHEAGEAATIEVIQAGGAARFVSHVPCLPEKKDDAMSTQVTFGAVLAYIKELLILRANLVDWPMTAQRPLHATAMAAA